jgi:cobalt/nickel transport system permease protein
MHIADGIVPVSICIAADAAALGGAYLFGRNLEAEEVPKMGLTAAAVFTVSLLNFPLGGASIHLGLLGFAGILLGLRAFPVVFATLLFQSLVFQHGGLISLGLNAVNMGTGALAGWLVWRAFPFVPSFIRAFAAGFIGIFLPALMMASEFSLSGYGKGIFYIIMVYLPAAAIEGVLTVLIIGFFQKSRPGILEKGKK